MNPDQYDLIRFQGFLYIKDLVFRFYVPDTDAWFADFFQVVDIVSGKIIFIVHSSPDIQGASVFIIDPVCLDLIIPFFHIRQADPQF